MKSDQTSYLSLFIAFFKIGLFTIGGGYAMLPMLQKEVVDHYHWTTEDELMGYFAIGQSTPGIIAINTATFIGYNQRGVLGGIVATLGMVFPSWIIIILIAIFFQHFSEHVLVKKAFIGIRIVVAALILNAVIQMVKKATKAWWSYGLMLLGFVTVGLLTLSPILIIIISGTLGIAIHIIRKGGVLR